jgi:hypothetical protein
MDRELGVRIYALAIVLLVVAVASGCASTGEPPIHQPIQEWRGYVSLPPGYVSELSASPQYRYEVGLIPTSLPDARPIPEEVARAPAPAPTKQASMSDFKVPNGMGEGAWDGFKAGLLPGMPLVVLPLTVAAGAAIGIVNARRLAEKPGR